MIEGALVITGPTASGKSSLALELASRLGGEIVSADSAQVYLGMDIGTAKPDAETQATVRHHLIDIRHPDEPYSAADFRDDALRVVTEIQSRDVLPIITGGTMLYLKALKEGLSALPPADQAVRDEISREAEIHGWLHLHEALSRVDPEAASRINPTDPQRLQRALEVYRISGKPLSSYHAQTGEPCPFPLLEIAIMPLDRAPLHKAIEERFRQMLDQGFVEEVRKLKNNPELHVGLPAVRAVGYRQIWSFLEGEVDEQTMIETGLAATRQLAKRQYTWLRGWQDLHVVESPDLGEALKIVGNSTILE